MATYYLSPSGSDGNDGSINSPWKTFGYAFGQMSAEDELILKDGTYSVAAGTGYISYLGTGSGQPPSGTSKTAPTIVRAQNEGSVTVDGGSNRGLFIGRSFRKDSYIKIQGITFEGGGSLYNTSYVYVKNCGFHHTEEGSGSVFGVGTNDHTNGNTYNLVEDCWVWGRSRLIVANYRADYTVWRRVVIRGDGCNSASCTGSGNPNVGMTVYDSDNVSVQNVLQIDRILDGGQSYGDFASAQHTSGNYLLGPNEWLGCLSLASADSGFHFEADYANDYTYTVRNCVAWDATGTGFNSQCPNWTGDPIRNITIENFTAGESGSQGMRVQDSIGTATLRNLISYNSGSHGINVNNVPSYSDVYGAVGDDYYDQACTIGCLTSDPTNDGIPPSIKYICRIESGSALDGTGYSGEDYGANIVYRYGTDGAFHGDSGYNALSSTELWPWPNQARIKSEMSADSTRGFCAVSENLTHYIWNYLGNGDYPDSVAGVGVVILLGI